MEIKSFIIYLIGLIITSYYTDVLLGFILKRKIKKCMYTFIYSILNLVHVYISDYLLDSLNYKYVSFYIINWLFVYLLYEGTVLKKGLAYFEMISAVLFTELIGTQIASGLLGVITRKEVTKFTDIRVFVNFVCGVLFAIIVCLYIFIQKKIQFNISIKKLEPIVMLFLSQAIIGSVYNLILWDVGMNISSLFLIYIFAALIIDIWLLRSMSLLEIKEDTEEKIKNFEKETELIAEYYSDLSENINNLENIKSEYNDELKNIYSVTGKLNKFEEVREERNLDKAEAKSTKKEVNRVNSNVLVDNIISNIKAQLDLLNVEYKIDVDVPEKINIDYGDLSSILINMFGNAVEAVELYVTELKHNIPEKNIEKYYLEGVLCVDEKEMCIEVKNVKSSKQKTRMLDDKYITSKKDKDIHGYGMQIIKRITDKYDGKMEVEYTNNSFKNTVTLSCE